MSDLETIIEDAISDAALPDDTPEVVETPEASTSSETATEATDTAPEVTTETEETPTPSSEVSSPAAAAAKAEAEATPKDEFETKFGISKESTPGRENRIPYSRVTKIVGKAVSEAETKAKAEWEPKLKALTDENEGHKTYRTKVEAFEKMMVGDQEKFIRMLYTLPQYQQILSPLFIQPAAQAQVEQVPVDDNMPQPDVQQADGTAVYSMEGLKKLNEWNRTQARTETLAEVEKKFGPLYQSYETYQREQELRPIVQAQIQEAYTWPLFKENEAEITKVLADYPQASLEAAYRHVVVPKIQAQATAVTADKSKLEKEMRAKILQELKSAPTSTSAPHSSTKPGLEKTGPRSLEDIIKSEIDKAGLR